MALTFPNSNTAPSIRVARYDPDKTVHCSLGLVDQAVRDQAPGFDGLERPFVRAPVAGSDGRVWKNFYMGYNGTFPRREAQCSADVYQAYLPFNEVRPEDVRRFGVAFGMDTNVGTLWFQKPGDNFYINS